ncbi:XrtA/PEP-CTERM system-associated ATPase [Rhodopila globiformis]|uniref:ATPase n=1 Tax=Rhodopila globiformis TaxID=1071 RepID=A0A2S6NNC9_RHOGL|nr:XrtA/PEP-CTERM system-associated ATPase [Rhodopila globiformis]PPQ38472.1 ATPase [Rhodopila globiformis]
MFDTFYKLSGQPFLLTPDTRFFFGSSGHSRAIAHLVYGLAQQEGFIVITGEVGAGKTTLVEQLWAQLDRSTYVMARVVTTQVSGDDLLRLAMAGFGLGENPGTDKATLLRRFEHMVRDQRRQGRRCLLVVDEVQNLSLAALEELRMLSNITVDGRASVQTILLGQPQFRPILASRDVEQLRQRVLASYHLGPLTEAETRGYVQHRLRTVGWADDPAWEDDAFAAVHRATGGIPRRINTLCARVLLLGALEETHAITALMVEETAEELRRDLGDGQAGGDASAARPPVPADALAQRIEALEAMAARQDRVSRRILQLLEDGLAGNTAGAQA